MLSHPAPSTQHPALSPRTAFWVTDILSDSAARSWAFGEGGSLDFPFPVAVKTGTSQAYRDNWCIGYTREVTVGVWVGNFDRGELHNSSGITGAGPIFHSVMLAAMKGRVAGDIVDVPPGLERVPICTLSGARPSMSCPQVAMEWLPSDALVTFCSWHHEGRIDWPPEYRDWAGVKPQSVRADVARRASLRVTNPVQGATYLIDPTLRTPFQALHLRAAADAPVHWSVDGQRVAEEWPLQPGRHTIVATDDAGHRDTVTITVK
jgi:penicillin-binding protein 1C